MAVADRTGFVTDKTYPRLKEEKQKQQMINENKNKTFYRSEDVASRSSAWERWVLVKAT